VLGVSLLHRSGILARRGIGLTISCSRACAVTVQATVTPQVGAARTELGSVSVNLPGGAIREFHLSMTAHGLSLMRNALGRKRRRGLRAEVSVSAISLAGGGLGESEPATFAADYHVTR